MMTTNEPDVMAIAREMLAAEYEMPPFGAAYSTLLRASDGTDLNDTTMVALRAIAKALEGRTEAAAKIADAQAQRYRDKMVGCDDLDLYELREHSAEACEQVAYNIRAISLTGERVA
jgi:hypothetical protein